MSHRLAATVLLLTSCNGNAPSIPDASMADAATADASVDGPPDAAPAAIGGITLPGCVGLSGIDERCTLQTDASACTTARCSKLVVLFTGGGDRPCDDAVFTTLLADYAAQGWAGVCIKTFETADASNAVPYVDETPRYDHAIREATTGAWAQAFWTGEQLLFEGVSHGASTPVIAMARTAVDSAAHWRGTQKTAACMFDGTYDQQASYAQLSTGAPDGGPCLAPVPARRWLTRYCGPTATAQSCDLAAQPKALEDSIAGAPLDGIAIRDFRLIECGSALPVCTGDVLPAAPIAQLCSRLEASPDHTCTYATLPTESHGGCLQSHGADCRTWFDAL